MIANHIEALRQVMKREGICAFITPSTDPHAGEYVPEHWKSRQWISGFCGSAGTAVVTLNEAALWTDSRYFIAATEQLQGTEFQLMKEKIDGTPTIAEWLGKQLPEGSVVAIDGWVNTVESVEQLSAELAKYNLNLRTDLDPYAEIWTTRPSRPQGKAFVQGLEYAGETTSSKLQRIRERLGNRALLVSLLEEVAWTLNLRGSDVEYTPFLVSYLFITPNKATLYIEQNKLTDEVEAYLHAEQIAIQPYDSILADITRYEGAVSVAPATTNHMLYSAIKHPHTETSPIGQLLMFKNETEIQGYHNAMLKDGLAMTKWIKWTMETVPMGGQTELSLAAKLEAFRAEQPLFVGLSFESIMAYGPHGAIVHYEPTKDTNIPVKAEGLLLIDSGGQYRDGTTDITRTIPLGPLTDEMRRDYTLVLKGWIRLGSAVFPKGTCGTQLDVLARDAMWRHGINYMHGTGHGVGAFMSVHESIDLHQIRMQWRPTPLLPGMTVTDEPGIYIEGSHGVRHENTMLVVEANVPNNVYGPYCTFEHLTLCPVITSPILTDMLSADEIAWFNNYQQKVYNLLFPHLDKETASWLREQTRPIA